MKMYSIYDTKAEAYMKPFFWRSHGEALRFFYDEAARDDSILSSHPEDFVLFYVGEFDENEGFFDAVEPTVSLGRASDAREEERTL